MHNKFRWRHAFLTHRLHLLLRVPPDPLPPHELSPPRHHEVLEEEPHHPVGHGAEQTGGEQVGDVPAFGVDPPEYKRVQ